MGGELFHLVSQRSETSGMARGRVARMVSIISAINAGELLAALPECAIARRAHEAALNLLTMLEFELIALTEELESEPSHGEASGMIRRLERVSTGDM